MRFVANDASASSCATPRPRRCRRAVIPSCRRSCATLLSSMAMVTPGAAPARLGRYELLARLAAGGMGEIFLARLEGAAGFEKLFVIKRILPHLADDERFRAMLIAEARIASMMAHANICQVYELGETDGQLYIVMEYLEGVTMLPLLRKASKEQEIGRAHV